MTILKSSAVFAALCLSAFAVQASPAIESLTVAPAGGARVGEKVTVTVGLKDASDGLCGIELEFADGRRETFKIKPDTKLPIVVEHTYKSAADMKIRAAGTRVENALGCLGKEIVMYKVSPAPAAAPAAAASSGPCPGNWALKGKAAKNGAFTCVPAKGVKDAAKPAQPLACPAGTSYFTKGKTLGCEAG